MLEIDLTLDGRQLELEYLFKLVTGDAGDFIYLRSHDQPADSKENNETDWSKGFDLLCRLSTGKFHVAEAVSLLDLIGQLSKKEIDEICNQILDSTHHLKYAQIINKSSLLGAYRQKRGDVPSVDVYTAFSNGDPKKVHSKFL